MYAVAYITRKLCDKDIQVGVQWGVLVKFSFILKFLEKFCF